MAFHYGRSENQAKQMGYLLKAGEAAQKNFANDAALEYYGLLLPLLKDDREKQQIHLKRGEVLELMGKWDDAEGDYRAALDSAKDNVALIASAQYALGKLDRLRGDFVLSLAWLTQASEAWVNLRDNAGLARTQIEKGILVAWKGEYTQAREPLNEGLVLAREAGDKMSTALGLNHLGIVTLQQGDYVKARKLFEESLELRRQIGDKPGISASLTNLGSVARRQGNYATAQTFYEKSLELDREMGNKRDIAISLNNLGFVAYNQGDNPSARKKFEESLALQREIGD